jgi:phosphatidylglycerophosphate synthase
MHVTVAGASNAVPEAKPRDAKPMPAALVFATAPTPAGVPAALQVLEGSSLLGRLLDQCAELGVGSALVVTRPQDGPATRAAVAACRLAVDVVTSEDLAADMRIAAEAAERAGAPLLIARGESLVHQHALASLIEDPRMPSGILTTTHRSRGRGGSLIRAATGRVVSASSPFHRTTDHTGYFLDFISVAGRDLDRLAGAAQRLAGVMSEGPPPSWEAEFDRKVRRWRRRLRAGSDGGAPRPGTGAPEAEAPVGADEERAIAARVAVARNDAVALLLVGLVRSGTELVAIGVRGFYYARPLSEAQLRTAAAELRDADEDRAALDAAVKAVDGFFTTFLVSPYSRYIARWAARHGLSPNALTAVSLVIGMVAAAAFAVGSRAALVAGAVLLQAAFTIDCVDGQVARYTRTFSTFGAWFDSVADRAKEYAVYAGLAVGASAGFGQDVWALAAAALTLQTVRHMFIFSAMVTDQRSGVAAAARQPLEEPDDRRLRAAGAGSVQGATAASAAVTRHTPGGKARRARRGPLRPARIAAALDRHGWVTWVKRIIVLPIGERFALISITAALLSPRTTFIALLAWGGFAAVYAVGGTVSRSLAR